MRIQAVETQIDAYHAHVATGSAKAQRDRILNFIEAKGGDWSIGEIALKLSMEKSTVSARLNELLKEDRVITSLKRKDRVSGVMVRPVRLPVKQFELI